MTKCLTKQIDLADLTSRIASAYVAKNHVPIGQVGSLIGIIYKAVLLLASAKSQVSAAQDPSVPAVPISQSITTRYLICLEEGKRFRSLRSHLRLKHNMTPSDYRKKWKLPSNYPMSAPSYSANRVAFAHRQGLGLKIKPDVNKGPYTLKKKRDPN
ncbi:MucR family transcriptional regulator [Mesorhizobium sp. SB112]|uniref:MucR family transcriptional regulator n=1 Tax=Mesorhizobium sp. SB112 TaxID=3151853 RepID=UPI0032643C9E